MPTRPWSVVHADLCGPFPSGESLLVLVDSCSRWPEVFIMKSTTATAVIKIIKSCFATHGLPEEIVTDNGPQFVAEEFKSYLTEHGIKHRRVTPYWPQANSEVERFNRTLEKATRAAHAEGKNWKNEIDIFLLNYRATAHCTTGKAPAVLLFGRNIRTKLPSLSTQTAAAPEERGLVPPSVIDRDRIRKQKMKEYADKKRRAVPSDIKQGDQVLLKQQRKSKLSTAYDPKPYTVEGKKGTSLLLRRSNEPQIMRNSSAVRKVPSLGKNGEVTKELGGDEEDKRKRTRTELREQRSRKTPDYFGFKK